MCFSKATGWFGRLVLLAGLCALPARAVTLSLVRTNLSLPAGTTLQVPLTGADTQGLPLKFSVVSISDKKHLQGVLASRTNRWLRLNVSGVNAGSSAGVTGLQFDGAQNYVEAPNSADFIGEAMTYEFWFNSTATGERPLLAFADPQVAGFVFHTVGGGTSLRVAADNANGEWTYNDFTTPSYLDGRWHHLAVQETNGLWQVFLDGTNCGTWDHSGSPHVPSGPLVWGKGWWGQWFEGTLDEIRISNVIRYSGDSFVPPTSLADDANTVAHWRLNEGAGTTVFDSTANHHDGTLMGDPPPQWSAGIGVINVPFTGALVLQLFEDLTPRTTARIIQLVRTNFYNGLKFHRVIQDFMAQGGDPNGDGTGGSGVPLDDEFTGAVTFNGFGQLAMANSGADTGDSQFFITDPDLSCNDTNKLAPYWLNFKHTIFGQMTRGFDVLAKIMATPVDPSSAKPLTDVVINSASLITNTQDAVLRLTAATGFVGQVTVTVKAANSKGKFDKQSFVVNVISNTLDNPPFLVGQFPTSIVVTQNTMATFLAGIYTDDTNAVAWGYDQSPNVVPYWAYDYSPWVRQYWYFPDQSFTGHVDMIIGVTDGQHTDQSGNPTYDTQRFTMEVLPMSTTPTMTIIPRSGAIQTVTNTVIGSTTNALNDVLRVSGSLVFAPGSDRRFAANDIIHVNIGDPANPLDCVVYPLDARTAIMYWKQADGTYTGFFAAGTLAKGVLKWRSPIPTNPPNVNLTLNSNTKTFNITATRFDYPSVFTNNTIIVNLTVGNDFGTNTSTWIPKPKNVLAPPPVH